ncbi:PEP-CTERM sorting domain-containing protein [Glaciimonas sp. GNP009]
MKLSHLTFLAAALFSLAAVSNNAIAAAITSLSGTAVTIPVTQTSSAGPIAVTPNITWSSTTAYSVFGYNASYGFGNNGNWNANLSMVGSNSASDTMTFSFLAPVAGFGGFLNYAPGYGPTAISTYDAMNTLLESALLTFTTNGSTNSGEFLGFLDTTADISSFTLQGAYIGGANFIVVDGDVPEAASLALLSLGLLGFGLAHKRRQSVA